jgi:hypothetical protein
MNDTFDPDPPFAAAGAFQNNYDESLAIIKGPLPVRRAQQA